MRVLLIRLGAFGDIVHTLPLAADLAASGHEIGWLCEDRWACLLEGSPAVRHIHRLPRKLLRTAPWNERLRSLMQLRRELVGGGYDAVIDAQGLAKSALAALFCGAGLRLGHGRPRAREGAWLAYHRNHHSRTIHVIDQQRDLGRMLGHPPAGRWQFPLPPWEAEQRWADSVMIGNGLQRPWILNVGAGWPTKVWPVQRQADMVRALGQRGDQVLVVWGGPDEESVAREVVAAAGHGIVAPRSSIPQLAALLRCGRVVISGDTGPLHLALAVGTPAVGLFGPVPAERNGPRGRGYRTLQAPGAAWERKDLSKVDMGAITAAQVIAAADAAMGDVDA